MGITTTREFRWDDPGAPVLNSQVGALYNLLKHCLVGQGGVAYGSGPDVRPAAGWSLAWDDPSRFAAVFRCSQAHGGSGCYLRVLDDGSMAGGRLARIDVYEQMSDIDTGSATAGGGFLLKSSGGNSGSAWTLHADERTGYMTVHANGPSPIPDVYDFSCMFGDINPVVPSDPGVCIASGPNNNVATNSRFYLSSIVAGHLHPANAHPGAFSLSRSAELKIESTPVAICSLSGNPGGHNAIGGNSNCMAAGAVVDLFAPAIIVGGGVVRGRARGLFIPLNHHYGRSPVGSVVTPMASAQMSFAALSGRCADTGYTSSSGRLFVERNLSWDDV